MTVLFMEGFDGYPAALGGGAPCQAQALARGYVINVNTCGVAYNAGRVPAFPGTVLWQFNNIGMDLRLPAGSDLTAISVGFALKMVNSDNGTPFFRIIDANGVGFFIGSLNTLAGIRINYDPTGTANDISNVDIAVQLQSWNYFEVSWSPTAIKVYINNVLVFTKTGTFPAIGHYPTVVPVTLFPSSGVSFLQGYMDDVYVIDSATPLGECYVRNLAMTADTALTGTVVGAADAKTALTSFDGNTSYVNLVASGEKAWTSLDDITDNPASIYAVGYVVYAAKTDTGSADLALRMKTASESTVSTVAVTTGYQGARAIVHTDPADSAPWTKARVNSLETGVQRV